MSYSAQEASQDSGQPVELYDFVLAGIRYSVCTCADAVTYNGTTYTPLAIERDAIQIGPEDQSTLLQLTMPSTHALPQSFINNVPGVLCSVTITRVHKTDTTNELFVAYKGILRSVIFSDKGGVAQVGLMSQVAAMGRNIPRYTYQSLCNHVLYDRWCTTDKTAFQYNGTGSNLNGYQFDVAGLGTAKGSTWANGGYVVMGTDYRLILSQTNDTLTLLLPFNTTPVGQSVSIFAGCDHSINMCKAKFNNVINFGGFPYIPTSNPFQVGLQ